ncbi:uncharacterized protein LOC110854559 [Folsomia candida]|uniref:Uncharacterized protein n=1 Tax=Folsomia candida TaxID=158441 RepID=A0A226DY85_FOLCA|nr:uncharacterized protein LOC110854559 [Folsomia candida]XP_035711426.1 uncharacterized protein LOC110854559 [Folsomia candida]OXA49651.1 hypothetical protein Fcan01_15584 [Folsomia candida]
MIFERFATPLERPLRYRDPNLSCTWDPRDWAASVNDTQGIVNCFYTTAAGAAGKTASQVEAGFGSTAGLLPIKDIEVVDKLKKIGYNNPVMESFYHKDEDELEKFFEDNIPLNNSRFFLHGYMPKGAEGIAHIFLIEVLRREDGFRLRKYDYQRDNVFDVLFCNLSGRLYFLVKWDPTPIKEEEPMEVDIKPGFTYNWARPINFVIGACFVAMLIVFMLMVTICTVGLIGRTTQPDGAQQFDGGGIKTHETTFDLSKGFGELCITCVTTINQFPRF